MEMSQVQKFKPGDYIIWDRILWLVLNTDNQMYELKLVKPRQFTTKHGNGGYMDSSVIDQTGTLYTISSNGGSKRITKKKRRSYKKGGGRPGIDNTLYEISFSLYDDSGDPGSKIDAFITLNRFVENMNLQEKPEAKPANPSVNDYFDRKLRKNFLKIKFDVKFDKPKTQDEVKTWFDKYFGCVEGSFNSTPIEERPEKDISDD